MEGYGLVAEDGIPKPAFDAFALLHQLGDERIALDLLQLCVGNPQTRWYPRHRCVELCSAG